MFCRVETSLTKKIMKIKKEKSNCLAFLVIAWPVFQVRVVLIINKLLRSMAAYLTEDVTRILPRVKKKNRSTNVDVNLQVFKLFQVLLSLRLEIEELKYGTTRILFHFRTPLSILM